MVHFPRTTMRFLCVVALVVLAPSWSPNSTSNSIAQSVTTTTLASSAGPNSNEIGTANCLGSYGKLPISFEPNRGQTDSAIQFLARGMGYTLFLAPGEAVLSLHSSSNHLAEAVPRGLPSAIGMHDANRQKSMPTSSTVHMRLIGSNPSAQAVGVDPLPGRSNYFIGSDPSAWHTDVPTFAKVRYRDVYPGVDLVYYGNQQGKLEHDFIVAPGTDPSTIAIAFSGAGAAKPDKDGGITIRTQSGDLTLLPPTVYQDVAGRRVIIPANYQRAKPNQIGFHLGTYNRRLPLIIDPVLTHTAILGGSDNDFASAIAVDKYGQAYITGATYSTDFPTENPYQSSWTITNPTSSTAAFVSKINPAGTALVYSTYLGGPFSGGEGIAIDSSGRAYVTGGTGDGFPVQNAAQATFGGGAGDAFLTVLSPSGNSLVFSTYLGGNQMDYGLAITLDAAENIYITGRTDGAFPALHSIQPSGTPGVFVAKFNSTGALQYSSMYGNIAGQGTGLAVDSSGAAYIAGYTNLHDIPITPGVYRSTCSSPQCGWAAKIAPTGDKIDYSTYLGSTNGGAYALALDSANDAYIAGATGNGFPVESTSFQKTYGGGDYDGFVMKLNPTGTGMMWSTYLGGNGDDVIYGLALDQYRTVYVSGWTCSSNFPLKASIQAYSRTSNRPCQLFVTTISGSLNSIEYYSTYLGSATFSNQGNYIAIDSKLNAYLTGYGTGNLKATPGAINTGSSGVDNPFSVFASKLDIEDDLVLGISASPNPVSQGQNLTYTITVTSKGPDFGTNVFVTDSVPGGTTFVSVEPGGAVCKSPTVGSLGVINCTLPQLNKGSTWTLKMTVKVIAPSGASIYNSAATMSNMQDFTISNNVGVITTPVQ